MIKPIVFALPFIFVWGYYDTQKDIANLAEGQQVLGDTVELLRGEIIQEQPRYLSERVTYGPVPQVILPRVEVKKTAARKEQIAVPLKIVKTNQKVKHDKLDLFCMAKNIFHEAGVEDIKGRYAVAQVTLNRMASGNYPGKVCEVVMQPYQFSWANNRKIRWTHPKGKNWEESQRIAHNVLVKGYRLDGLEDALFYHADYVKPHWKKPEAKITKIGTHIFYASAK